MAHLAKTDKLSPEEAAALLRMIGLSYRKIGELITPRKSEATVRNVILQTGQGYFSKSTAKKIWDLIEKHKEEAEQKIARLKQAA